VAHYRVGPLCAISGRLAAVYLSGSASEASAESLINKFAFGELIPKRKKLEQTDDDEKLEQTDDDEKTTIARQSSINSPCRAEPGSAGS
jgi:hypothetical protein